MCSFELSQCTKRTYTHTHSISGDTYLPKKLQIVTWRLSSQNNSAKPSKTLQHPEKQWRAWYVLLRVDEWRAWYVLLRVDERGAWYVRVRVSLGRAAGNPEVGVQAWRLPDILPAPQHLRENRQIDRSSPQFYPANQDLPRGQEKYPSDVTSCC